MNDESPIPGLLDLAAASHVGTERELNEDRCEVFAEGPACALAVVADGVSGSEAGEVASEMAVEALIRAFREGAPGIAPGLRLYRAVQQANIEIHDRALAVPELRGMATTLTAAVVDRGELTAVHVGDSRLYLVRDGAVTQLTKDHTVAAEKARYGLMSKERARLHADRSVITRSVGRELIVSRDRLTHALAQGDVVVLCSDGLYNVLTDSEIGRLAAGRDAAGACRALIDAANARGTPDNLSAAVVRVVGAAPGRPEPARGVVGTLRRLFRTKP
jgi:PPM family protein phosphatase